MKQLIRQTSDGKTLKVIKLLHIGGCSAITFPSPWVKIFAPNGLVEISYDNETGIWSIIPLGQRKIVDIDGTIIGTSPSEALNNMIDKSVEEEVAHDRN